MATSLSSPYNGTSVATHILDGYANLVCDVKGHEKQRIVYICANASCQRPERLLCTKCAITHGDSQYFVLVDDIIRRDEFMTENWPIDFEGQQIKMFLGQHNGESFEQVVEGLFTELEEKIAEKLDVIKQDMKLSFKKQSQTMTDEIVRLHLSYSKAYSLDSLKSTLFAYIEETIGKLDVEGQIKQFLTSRERIQDKIDAKKFMDNLIPKCNYYVDTERFHAIAQNEIIQNVDKLCMSFKSSFSPTTWKFVNSELYQSKALLEITPGITYQSKSDYGEEIILSDRAFQYGIAHMRIRFDKVSENYRCHTLIGLHSQSKDEKESFFPCLCLTCNEYSEGMICQNNIKFNIQPGSIVEMIANFDKNSLVIREILDDEQGGEWVSSQLPEKLNASPKKFFVYFMSCGNNQITLLSSY